MSKLKESEQASQVLQIGLPFLAAGAGMVLAGAVLDEVQGWNVFKDARELFILKTM